ncbi:MAG: hypothetical protein WBA82_05785 [Castellaniella sp.]|uniref:hypothetical protein n=1 Tax=Castellaniella sp. TaxID=1955812 RepID=UPI003C794134
MSAISTVSSYLSWGAQESAQGSKNAPVAEGAKQPRGDQEVRESYNVKISEAYQEFKTKFQEFHDQEQCFGEALAREAYEVRSKIKEEHQEQTSYLGRAAIWLRNMVMYSSSNASYEGLSKTKNPEEIAYSAFKTGGGDLGLKNNGFGDKLDVWNAIKEVSTLYPEDITDAMVSAYKAQEPGKVDVDAILAARSDTSPTDAFLDLLKPGTNTFKTYA